MYKINDTVVYANEGICVITDIADKTFNATTEKYYILKPTKNNYSTVMIPVNNQKLVGRMRHVLSVDEVEKLISDMPSERGLSWNENDKSRKEQYKQIICSGSGRELVSLIVTLYNRKQQQESIGKRLHATDERFFREAEQMLYDEFAVVLNIDRDKVLEYITSKIGPRSIQA